MSPDGTSNSRPWLVACECPQAEYAHPPGRRWDSWIPCHGRDRPGNDRSRVRCDQHRRPRGPVRYQGCVQATGAQGQPRQRQQQQLYARGSVVSRPRDSTGAPGGCCRLGCCSALPNAIPAVTMSDACAPDDDVGASATQRRARPLERSASPDVAGVRGASPGSGTPSPTPLLADEAMPASLAREIALLKKIASHPHVVHLVEAVELGHGDDRVALGECLSSLALPSNAMLTGRGFVILPRAQQCLTSAVAAPFSRWKLAAPCHHSPWTLRSATFGSWSTRWLIVRHPFTCSF